MKVIDLLNKIANGEIDSSVKFSTMYDYCDIKGYTHRYILNENTLNEEIKTIDEWVEDISKEEKKIPDKLGYCEENTFMNKEEPSYLSSEERRLLDSNFKELSNKINSIIDYLKSKGE